MKYKLYAFLSGRNGMDDLSKVIIWPSLTVMLLSCFVTADWLRSVLYLASTVAFFYAYFRVFSRNLEKRQAENRKYVSWRDFQKLRFRQRKTYCFYSCPKCRTHLRVPKGKGRVNITCRSCGEKFQGRT